MKHILTVLLVTGYLLANSQATDIEGQKYETVKFGMWWTRNSKDVNVGTETHKHMVNKAIVIYLNHDDDKVAFIDT